MLIDKWLEHRSSGHDAYHDWFYELRTRRHAAQNPVKKQVIAWNKGDFVPENIFCRTVDTGRLIPLDRTWTTHVYHHKTMSERKLSMMPVVFTMLPELMLLRGMHDGGCDEVYIIVTDLKRQEMDDVTEYFKLVTKYSVSRSRKNSTEQQIQYQHMRLKHTLVKQHRLPCFPQIDLALRAILFEKRPRFIVLFSHQTTSYSQIFFTHRDYVPDSDIFFDYPTGCPNPCCTEECEMIRFPRRGINRAAILPLVDSKGRRRKFRRKEMCNWIDCDICFGHLVTARYADGEGEGSTGSVDESEESVSVGGSEGGNSSVTSDEKPHLDEGKQQGSVKVSYGHICGKCRLVRYCSQEHQFADWPEHKRVCTKV
ncbi:hypothetical protein Ac2012v2_005898 [Leucoagaricus gongylophorus]